MQLSLETVVRQERETEHKLRTLFEEEVSSGNTICDTVFFGTLGARPDFFEKAGKNVKATLSIGTKAWGKTAWHKVEVPVKPFPEVQDLRKGDRVFVVGSPEYYKMKSSPSKSVKFRARYIERIDLTKSA